MIGRIVAPFDVPEAAMRNTTILGIVPALLATAPALDYVLQPSYGMLAVCLSWLCPAFTPLLWLQGG
jgi:hypothetical protein